MPSALENGEPVSPNGEGDELGRGTERSEEIEEDEDDKGDDDNENDEFAQETWEESLADITSKLRETDYMEKLDNSKEEQSSFLDRWGTFIGQKPPGRRANVLHFLAERRCVSTWLIQHILQHHKDRMHDIDNAWRRPLTLAIQEKKEMFIRTVLASTCDAGEIENILRVKSSDQGNGIHIAIEGGLSPSLTIDLINKVSDEVLKQIDGEGCTPLHRAVEYSRCTEEQFEVVRALLDRGDSALDVKTTLGRSVYQHHCDTQARDSQDSTAAPAGNKRQASTKQKATEEALPVNTLEALGQNSSSPVPVKSEAGKTGVARELEKPGSGKSPAPNEGPRGHNRTASTNMASATSASQLQPSLQVGTANAPSKATRPVKKGTKGGSKGAGKGLSASKNVPTKEFAKRIANEVKLRYLRSTFEERGRDKKKRTHDTAVDFLYGNKQTKHIGFSLLLRDKPLHPKSLTSGSYSQFDFDETLQFVAVGPLAFNNPKAEAKAGAGAGRRDVTTLFDWLHKKKGVKNIIKVIVDDRNLKGTPHCDEAIINALHPFTIDILDWTKPDLCPKTISEACGKEVRKLYLSWSGLNGMLVAWGGPDGLARLPHLTDVYLRQTEQLDSDVWTKTNLDKFEEALKSARKEGMPLIKVHRPAERTSINKATTSARAAPEPNAQEPVIKDHQWLEIMDRFATAVCSLPPKKYLGMRPDLPDELARDVRICLIDDGVDTNHESITECMDNTMGKAFGTYRDEEHRDLVLPFYDSTTHHGTLMANTIVRVCPYAKIVSYRLDTGKGEDGKVHFTAKSAADALAHAANQDFDIISMSWTVKQVTDAGKDNSADIRRLREALHRVAEKRLVFCSPPDVGDISVDELASYYPVGAGVKDTKKIFRIGAATPDNNTWDPVGGQHIVDYILPGESVREKTGCDVVQNDQSLNSGSSIATALAAGLAALLIHIVRMAAIHTYVENKEDPRGKHLKDLASLKSPDVMRATLNKMANKESGKMYLHVWSWFNERSAALESAADLPDTEAEEKRWTIIADLAHEILR